MHRLEQLMITNGYEPSWLKGDCSSMGKIDRKYVKGDSVVTWGLYEQGLPPTLISPRPDVIIKGVRLRSEYFSEFVLDDNGDIELKVKMERKDLNRWIEEVSDEEFLKFIS